MRRSQWVSVFATVMACGLVLAVVLLAVGRSDRAESAPVVAADTAAQQDDEAGEEEAGGPPSWAHDGGKGGGHGADKAWKKAWHKLSPAQKRQKMAALAAAHEQGMKQWTDCMAAGGTDVSKGGTCEKPLPPGRAKRLP